MNEFSWFFLVLLFGSLGLKFWLNVRQIHHVRSHRDQVPTDFRDSIPLDAHQKAADYTLAKTRLSNLHGVLATAVLLILTFGGLLDALARFSFSVLDASLLSGVLFMLLVMLFSKLTELPLELYQTFNIEQAFGFNRSNAQQFLKDQALHLILTLVIGVPILALMLWIMDQGGTYWWMLAWLAFMGFSLLMTWAYPIFLAPLFNTFTPLSDDELKSRIQNLLSRCGFENDGIFVMDGSRRSGHGNAYFTGIGKNKRIVFFDTLLDALEPQEIEAVLAHELGHFKCKHVTKHLIASSALSLLGFATLGWLYGQSWFYLGLGVEQMNAATALMLLMLVTPIVLVFIKPVFSAAQRRFEFEADAFASTTANANDLIQALVKLYRDNASTLTPDPVYSGFHHSHPPASVRISHLHDQTQPATP